jgi:hypothetical protein
MHSKGRKRRGRRRNVLKGYEGREERKGRGQVEGKRGEEGERRG